MIMKENDFVDSLRGFYNHIRKTSIVPFGAVQTKKDELLKQLYREIESKTYQPSLPREYIISNKSNFVSRIIPTFTLKDFCVYFYCINNLQSCLCDEQCRTEGTFGGWSIGNPIKSIEDLEKENLIGNCEWYEYISVSSLALSQWIKNWKEFSKLAYAKSVEFGCNVDDYVVATFDIANFYDNIKFDILENKLRLKCQSTEHNQIIDLLMYFLKYWNKPFEGYFPKTVGLPQEETSDCSRILANFYLRDYDQEIKKLCQNFDCDYLRFADDMTVFAPNKRVAEYVLFEASKYLHKLGLNINCSKVRFFNRDDFQIYQAFEILSLLDDEKSKDDFNDAVSMYFQNKDTGKEFRSDRVIRRIISILSNKGNDFLNANHKERLFNELLNDDILSVSNEYYFKNVHKIMKQEGMEKEYFDKLDSLATYINFNSFHYQLLRFYKKNRKKNFDETFLVKEIEKRKVIRLSNI